jgi:hypothetical protein
MKRVIIAAAIVSFIGAPAFAQSRTPSPGTGDVQANRPGPSSAYGAVTPFGSPLAPANRAGREAAMRECVASLSKTYAVRDSNWSIHAYRACMAQHGQME